MEHEGSIGFVIVRGLCGDWNVMAHFPNVMPG